jgi:DNA-directed RNA polymerase alpha subunit
MEITQKQYERSLRVIEGYETQLKNLKDLTPLMDSDLSIRCISRLRLNGMKTIGDVRRYYNTKGIYGFNKITGLGRTSQEEIRLMLEVKHEVFYKFRWDLL